VSAVSAWEIAIKSAMGKLEFRGNLEEQMRLNGFLPFPITVAHAVAAGRLLPHHQDPFDRMLVAQASLDSLTLLTSDARLKSYNVAVVLV
jgi:PIN domain nuclease of toxin-antitoxin system